MKEFKTGQIRNIALVSHNGAGKTTLVERMLFDTKALTRMGSVQAEFELPEQVIAPLSKATSIGKARIVVDGATVASHDVYPADDVPAGGLFRRAVDSVRLWF